MLQQNLGTTEQTFESAISIIYQKYLTHVDKEEAASTIGMLLLFHSSQSATSSIIKSNCTDIQPKLFVPKASVAMYLVYLLLVMLCLCNAYHYNQAKPQSIYFIETL